MWTPKAIGVWMLLPAMLLLPQAASRAEIRTTDLNSTRSVLEREWLRLKLEVMGLRLSYPAYRINLELSENNNIVFAFLASGGMAEHLSELGPPEAKNILGYHAQGISDQVSALIREEFPVLWGSYESAEDFRGKFMVPAEDWNNPPRELAYWRGDSFYWNP